MLPHSTGLAEFEYASLYVCVMRRTASYAASTETELVVQVPFRLLKKFHNVQQRLVRELEKKFQGRDVVIIGNRRIMPPPKTGYALARPRSRTLTAVRPHSHAAPPISAIEAAE